MNTTTVEQTVTKTTSKAVKLGFKALITIGKVAGSTASALVIGAKQGYNDAKSELTDEKAPW
tara:strand:- start:312 stop:497 length:186 start_codon:yes stop_codon:yes gene_type:complete